MKSQKSTLINMIRVLLVVIAITFSNNMNAASTDLIKVSTDAIETINQLTTTTDSNLTFGRGWWRNWFRPRRPRRPRRPKTPKTPPADSVPLDGGLGILVLGAAAFGVRKLHGKRNTEQS